MHDVRYALRSLVASPIVSGVAILSLALSIGANTTIFSLINSLLLRPLPVKDPSGLVILTDAARPGIRSYGQHVWEQFRQHDDLFEGSFAWSPTEFRLTTRGEVQLAHGMWVSGSFFETLGVSPGRGRSISDADDRPGGGPDGPVAVISHGFWQRQFGSADVIGHALTLENEPVTIVGITPPGFSGVDVGRGFDVAVPFGAGPLLGHHENVSVTIMARLNAGQTRETATVALRLVQPSIREGSLPRDGRWRRQDLDAYLSEPFVLAPGGTGTSPLRTKYKRPLVTLMIVVGLVLLIACANIANLQLARSMTRRHELQVRMALGAGRWRLARATIIETALLAAGGSALGLLMASLGSRLLVRQLSTDVIPIHLDLSLDLNVLTFSILLTSAVALLFGIAPVVRTMRLRAFDTLKGSQHGASELAHGPSSGLIVAQVAISIVLVIAAGLFVRTFAHLTSVPLGFEADRVLMAGVSANDAAVPPGQRLALFERTRAAVRSLPDVSDAAFSFLTPVSAPILLRPIELGDSQALPETERLSAVNLVSPGYFHTFGTRMIAGREFTAADRGDAPPVVIVNQTFARRFVQGVSPVGRSVKIGIVGPNAASAEVVGVAADAIYSSLREPVPPTMYFPLAQLRTPPPASLTLSVRADRGPAAALIKSVSAAVVKVDPGISVTFRSLTDQIHASLAQERVVALLSGFVGGLAALLSGLGLFGITSHSVSRRRREIGIRMALGAAPTSVLGDVFSRVLVLVGIGLAIGAGVSLWASPFLTPLLFGLGPRDPVTFGGSALALLAICLLAAWRPARHATRIDPAAVLRSH